MTTNELRNSFLDFFSTKEHKIYPSDSLVPKDDPTLLFTSAGMNQFKKEFLGKSTEFRRRATCQRCLRTDDLDKVGRTSCHHTFFEMLGNFSFGDYFKNEAISLAWEFVTDRLGLPLDRLWVSVYQDDDEAYKIWRDGVRILPQRIVKLGAKENFWPANAPEEGPDGPCGPCSEIFYDQGREAGCGRPECKPGCGCGRFVEVWNLVFTQFARKGKNNLEPLPNKNIDTGMGLERMAAVLQGVPNNFEIDIFKPITEEIIHLSRLKNARLNAEQSAARNAIADHIRAVVIAIADGVLPSNDERGYVIRKLIRRAVWHGRCLGIEKPYLYKIVPRITKVMEPAYPDLQSKREEIARIVLAEEKRFHLTLKRAVALAKEMVAALIAKGKSTLGADAAFKLYDTYGLPIEMLKTLIHTQKVELDEEGFKRELQLQRQASRNTSRIEASVFAGTLADKHRLKPTTFVGDKEYSAESKVQALFEGDQPKKQVRTGCEVKIVLQATPFYGESGGQVGDTGIIKSKTALVEVSDTRRLDQTIIHLGRVVTGEIKLNDKVEARINLERRRDITRNHTATHLLQSALRKVLGAHVRQAGSWVGADRLRFDFSHFQPLTERQISRIEQIIAEAIKEDLKVEILEMPFEQAQKLGALAFFGDKYQEQVRVLKIGTISLELCGGTHLSSTAEIKMFKVINESSVASGIRRIEALSGRKAEEFILRHKNQLDEFVQLFGVSRDKLPGHIVKLGRRLKEMDKKLNASRMQSFKSRIDEFSRQAGEIGGVKVIAREIKSADIQLLRLMADSLKQKLSPVVIVFASVREGKVLMICALSSKLTARGLNAVKIIRSIASCIEGSGGGREDFAQAGGKNPAGIKKALSKVEEIVKEAIK